MPGPGAQQWASRTWPLPPRGSQTNGRKVIEWMGWTSRDFLCVIHLILKMIKWEMCFPDLFFRCQSWGVKMQSKRSWSSHFYPCPTRVPSKLRMHWSASRILLCLQFSLWPPDCLGKESWLRRALPLNSSAEHPRGNWDAKKSAFYMSFKICNKYLIFHCTVRKRHVLVILFNLPKNAFSSKEPLEC